MDYSSDEIERWMRDLMETGVEAPQITYHLWARGVALSLRYIEGRDPAYPPGTWRTHTVQESTLAEAFTSLAQKLRVERHIAIRRAGK